MEVTQGEAGPEVRGYQGEKAERIPVATKCLTGQITSPGYLKRQKDG